MGDLTLGRDRLGDLRVATEREWLVTNGIGGFAAGTVSGPLTRRHHGLLIAALYIFPIFGAVVAVGIAAGWWILG